MDRAERRSRDVNATSTGTMTATSTPTAADASWERFEALYRSSRDDVYAYVATLLREPAAAEDVTALAFERAYRRRRSFDRARGDERAWLFGIARNLLRQYHKHNRIESQARERLGMPTAWAECEEYEAVDDRMVATSLAPLLRVAVRALPAEQQRALELRVVQQLDYEEVAGALGCTQNAARLRVSRALRALGLKLRGAQA